MLLFFVELPACIKWDITKRKTTKIKIQNTTKEKKNSNRSLLRNRIIYKKKSGTCKIGFKNNKKMKKKNNYTGITAVILSSVTHFCQVLFLPKKASSLYHFFLVTQNFEKNVVIC